MEPKYPVTDSFDEAPRDTILSQRDTSGWRLEITQSGFWLGTYSFAIRTAGPDDAPPTAAVCGGGGFRSQEAATEAGIADLANRLRSGLLKPR